MISAVRERREFWDGWWWAGGGLFLFCLMMVIACVGAEVYGELEKDICMMSEEFLRGEDIMSKQAGLIGGFPACR